MGYILLLNCNALEGKHGCTSQDQKLLCCQKSCLKRGICLIFGADNAHSYDKVEAILIRQDKTCTRSEDIRKITLKVKL